MFICGIIIKTFLRKTTKSQFTKYSSLNANTLNQIITQFSTKHCKDYCISFNA